MTAKKLLTSKCFATIYQRTQKRIIEGLKGILQHIANKPSVTWSTIQEAIKLNLEFLAEIALDQDLVKEFYVWWKKILCRVNVLDDEGNKKRLSQDEIDQLITCNTLKDKK